MKYKIQRKALFWKTKPRMNKSWESFTSLDSLTPQVLKDGTEKNDIYCSGRLMGRINQSHWVGCAFGLQAKVDLSPQRSKQERPEKRQWKLTASSWELSRRCGQRSRSWRKRIKLFGWSWFQIVREPQSQGANQQMNGKRKSQTLVSSEKHLDSL